MKKSTEFLKKFARNGELPGAGGQNPTPPAPEPAARKVGPPQINPKFETQHTSIRIHKELYGDMLTEKTRRAIEGNKITADIIINEALAARYGKDFQKLTAPAEAA